MIFVKIDSFEKGAKRKWEQEEQLRRQKAITRHAPGYAGHVKIVIDNNLIETKLH